MRRHRETLRVLVFTALTGLTASSAHANLILNPSFELGAFVDQGNETMSLPAGPGTTITDWGVGLDAIAWINAGNPWGLSAQDGNKFLDLTNYEAGAPFGGVFQTIPTTPGADYVLTFYLGSYTARWGGPPVSITAFAGNAIQQCINPSVTSVSTWTLCTVPFTASAAQTGILLAGVSGVNYIGLDNVSVELADTRPPVPEPATMTLTALGLAGVAARVRRSRQASDQ